VPVQSNASSGDHSTFYALYALLFDVLRFVQHAQISLKSMKSIGKGLSCTE